MASTVRSRRRITAIAVPSAVAVLAAGAFAAAPAIAASPTPSLPFPTVCSSGQTPGTTASGSTSASPTTSSTSPSPTATGSTTASPSTTPTGSATGTPGDKATGSPSPSTTGATGTTGGGSASASPSPSTGSTQGGFWGWLNGVWTWIFSDAPLAKQPAVDAVAPVNPGDGGHFENADAALGAKQESGSTSTTASPDCISSASAAALAAKAAAGGTSEGVAAGTIPWVMKTPVLTMYDLTYNGVKTVSVLDPGTGKYTEEKVLDFTASKLTIKSMVTYSIQNGQTVYNNAGSGTTTTLVNPHLMTVSLSGSLFGLIPQTYTPTNQPPLPVGLTIPLIPVVFTGVTSQLAYLETGTISVPGFDGFAKDGVASPR